MNLTWWKIPEDMFLRDVAHIIYKKIAQKGVPLAINSHFLTGTNLYFNRAIPVVLKTCFVVLIVSPEPQIIFGPWDGFHPQFIFGWRFFPKTLNFEGFFTPCFEKMGVILTQTLNTLAKLFLCTERNTVTLN